MKKINLREQYPHLYPTDYYIEVTDEVAEAMQTFDRAEAAYWRRIFRNHAQFSLDRQDGIENEILMSGKTPVDVYESKIAIEQLYSAIAALPDKQAKRLYAHFFLGMSQKDIAHVEGVSKGRVSESIQAALKNLEKNFKFFS